MSTNREIFPIFHLPRELRDLIYVSLLQSLTTYTLPSGFKLHATHLPHPHLLLLSRQFKDEYTSLSRELSNLTIHDHCLGGSGYQLPQLPREVLGIQRVIFNVACTGFRDAAGEVEFHDRWVRGLLGQMKSDKKVGIRLHMGSGIRAGEYEASLLWSGCWTQGLEGLEVSTVRERIGWGTDVSM